MRRLLQSRRKEHKGKVANVGDSVRFAALNRNSRPLLNGIQNSRNSSVDEPCIARSSPPVAPESSAQLQSVVVPDEILDGLIEIKGFEDKTRLKRRIE